MLSLSIPIGLAGLLAVAATIQADGLATLMQDQNAIVTNEPHHVLATAYHINMANCAKALQTQSALSSHINMDFSRITAVEIRRSFDQMKQHHKEHIKTMGSAINSEKENMTQNMENHQSELGAQLTALENELHGTNPDAKKVATLAASIYAHLDSMSRMTQGQLISKMKM